MNRRYFGHLLAQTLLASSACSASGMLAAPRFSFMLWALARQASFERSLEIVASAGYQGVELVGEFHHWQPEETRRMLARIRSLGLSIDSMSGVDAGFAVPAKTELFLSQFKAHLVSAQALACPQVILLSGAKAPGLSPEVQRQTSIVNLTRAAELAAQVQIEIVIEPIDPLENPDIYLDTVAAGFSIVRTVNHPNLKVLYDLYHEQRAFGNLIEKLEANINWIGLVHVADVPGRHEPGTGEIDYGNIYRKLAQLRYQRWIAMEYYPTREPVASLREAREMAQRALAGQLS